ncbi:MAG: glycosyltransferase [Gaiellales bacterium]
MTGQLLHVAKVSGISGAENHLLLLLPALRERGYDVRLLHLHEHEPGAAEFADALATRGVPVTGMTLTRAADPRAFQRVFAHVRRERPELVHTHLVHADFHGALAARLAGVPHIASTKHGFNSFRERRLFALADRTVGRTFDLHVAISQGLADYLARVEGFAAGEFEIVHYGIEAGPEPTPPVPGAPIAIVGRLVEIKGHDTLLAAVERVPGLELEIVGEGPLRAEIEADIVRRGLGERVRLLGRVAPAGPAMERASIVVVPSRGEGFGMVALEAMERGRAVVASRVGGLAEIVADGETGLLVPPDDAPALAAALAKLASDPARVAALGTAGRRRALDVFAQERCTARIAELYDALLAR